MSDWTQYVAQLELHPGDDRTAVRARLRLLRDILRGVRAAVNDCNGRLFELNRDSWKHQ